MALSDAVREWFATQINSISGSSIGTTIMDAIARAVAVVANHATQHTDGTDDVQSATAAQKGLATAAQITKLDGVATGADVTADNAPQAHAASHAVSGGDTVFPADPGADRYLMWDDDPGVLVWQAVAGGGDMLAATYDPDVDGVIALAQLDTGVMSEAEHALDAHTMAIDGRDVSVDGTKLDGIEAAADVTDATNVNAAGAVMESDYNAQTILQATNDNTPAALTVGEQTVVGRITGGNITALTVAQLVTLALSAALPENTALILDAALSADGTYSGIVEAGTAGAALAFGDLVYLAVADSRWELADASAAATAFGKLGICVLAAAGDASATTILLWGKVRADTAFPALTIGAPVFISETAGDITPTAPVTSAAIVRIVGYGNTADELMFCPDNTFVELA